MPANTVKNNVKYVKEWTRKHSNPNGTVYLITNIVTGDTYVGSTRSPVKKRWWQTVSMANSGRAGLLYENVRLHGKENFEVTELYDCTVDDDLLEEENKYLDYHNPSLNAQYAKKCKKLKIEGNFY